LPVLEIYKIPDYLPDATQKILAPIGHHKLNFSTFKGSLVNLSILSLIVVDAWKSNETVLLEEQDFEDGYLAEIRTRAENIRGVVAKEFASKEFLG
jgi:hypothetical protein